MDRSLFLARLMGRAFVAIALGSDQSRHVRKHVIVEALHTGIVFYLFGLLSLLAGLCYRQSAQYVVRRLARHLHYSWLAYGDLSAGSSGSSCRRLLLRSVSAPSMEVAHLRLQSR